jgi:RimJ/RimL family protein N-acetyltransferase
VFGCYRDGMGSLYAPLDVAIHTPRLALLGATDDLLTRLLPVVRDGVVGPDENPFDDPMSLYAENPERELRWMRNIWKGRSSVSPEFWRLYFVVMLDDEPIGMQDLIGADFAALGTVTSFSWLKPGARAAGIGTEMRSAILHLAFEGLDAKEARSEGFVDNLASNRVSQKLGYEENGYNWATRRGEPARLQGWVLSRKRWSATRRADIRLTGVDACRAALGI